MIETLKQFAVAFLTWLRSVYSEPDGTGSSTRIHISALIAFVLGVGVSFAILVHRHAITIEQFNSFLTAGATFIVTVCGVLYGINKAASVLGSKTNGQQQ